MGAVARCARPGLAAARLDIVEWGERGRGKTVGVGRRTALVRRRGKSCVRLVAEGSQREGLYEREILSCFLGSAGTFRTVFFVFSFFAQSFVILYIIFLRISHEFLKHTQRFPV